ncbi:MAG: metal ABC transporter substrate-binding protein [Actinomycetes bacterium]
MTRETVSRILLALLLGGLLLATGCAAEKEVADTAGNAPLDVVASVSFLADVAQNVAGDRFEVRSLVPLETDPHSFEPTPKDLGEVAAADLAIINGGGLEGPLLKTLENAGGEATMVDASAGLQSRTPQPGEPPLESSETDPHFWLDPVLVKSYVATIRDAFAKADPDGAAEYEANAAAYTAQLDKLNAWIESQVAPVPAANRKLVMNHASHGYFADRYGFSVVGTVIPSVGTGETPTAKQLSDLTAAIRTSGARAIFVEIEENPKLAEQIAAETGIAVVDDLLDHSLTAADGVAPTYVDMMKFDTTRIVEALRR